MSYKHHGANIYLEAEVMTQDLHYWQGSKSAWALRVTQALALAVKTRTPVCYALTCFKYEISGPGRLWHMPDKYREQLGRRFPTFLKGLSLLGRLRMFIVRRFWGQDRRQAFARINMLIKDLAGGMPLGIAMDRRFGKWLPRYYVLAVQKAEKAGQLDMVLPLLARRLRCQQAIAEDQFFYSPYLSTWIAIILFVYWVMYIFIMPVFSEMYESFGGTLPRTAAIMISSLKTVANGSVLLILAAWLLMRINRFHEAVLPWIPFAGKNKRRLLVRELAQAMATFLSLGEDVLVAARSSLVITTSPWLKPRLEQFVAKVENGGDWATAWHEMKLGAFTYPWLMANAAAREDPQSGFNSLAEWLHEDISRVTRSARRWLMPCVVILLSLFVGAFAWAIYSCTWNMVELVM